MEYNGHEFSNTYVDKKFNVYKFNGLNYFQYKLSSRGVYGVLDENKNKVAIYANKLKQGQFNQ
jgi:hypothetical protein